MDGPFVTASDLALLLNVTDDTVRHWARIGRIPCLRVGHKTLRFDRDEVLAALKAVAEKDGPRSSTGGDA